MKESIQYDCERGCEKQINEMGEVNCKYNPRCCKLSNFNWLKGLSQNNYKNLFEVRFKNTRKGIYENDSGLSLSGGDIVVVEAQTGFDVGIITLSGAVVGLKLKNDNIDPETFEFKKIYRKAKTGDIERWQSAIAREQETMIKSRRIAAGLGLNMKIGNVEFQGDGSKAIFYYIADERVDFRQLIKDFAEEFRIRIEMKQIGARQEAGLIGGLGVCGQPLCCSRFIENFRSITTQSARCQDLSLNPQKLAGQCGKLKCCINYEAATYIDAQNRIPRIIEPLHLADGDAYLVKTDILSGTMWFSYSKSDTSNMFPLNVNSVKGILHLNQTGKKGHSLIEKKEEIPEFFSGVGKESITRFDGNGNKNGMGQNRKRKKGNGRRNDGKQQPVENKKTRSKKSNP